MELLEGESLQQRLQRGPFDMGAFLEHAVALADALDAAHARGFMHRDLKPANIFITDRAQVKILDFGLARHSPSHEAGLPTATAESVADAGWGVGTLAYMSPEQLRGEELDPRTDLGPVRH